MSAEVAKAMVDLRQAQLAAIDGLEIGDCLKFFYAKASKRDEQILELLGQNDELEADGPIISEGDGNGAFVLTWSWVSFDDTELSKNCATCEEQSGEPVKPIKLRDGTTECLCASCLEEITCLGCGAVEGTEEYGTVGDGFDGYCGSCADKRETEKSDD